MTTEVLTSVPEYLNWTTRVSGKGPNQKNTGWVLTLQTPLPGSNYPTNLYPRDPAILVYLDVDGVQVAVKHSRVEPDGTTTAWESNVVEVGDVVAVQLHRDTFKANKLDGSPNDPNWATSYFWELLSIVPSSGQVEAGAPTPPRPPAAGTPATGHPAPTPPAFQVEGVVKGHCENIIAQLAVAKLLPGIEADDGGIDWDLFRTYRDLYFHNVSNVPIEPLVSEEGEEVEEEGEV
jgi:hypothetical protein